jgi:hypothetical protein
MHSGRLEISPPLYCRIAISSSHKPDIFLYNPLPSTQALVVLEKLESVAAQPYV